MARRFATRIDSLLQRVGHGLGLGGCSGCKAHPLFRGASTALVLHALWSLVDCWFLQSLKMARRFATRNGAIRANRFAEEPLFFHNVRALCANIDIVSNLRFALFSPPEARFAKKKGFRSGILKRFARIRRFARICESIRANRAI